MPIYCNYEQWLRDHNKDLYNVFDSLCYFSEGGIRCNTLICPDANLKKKMITMAKSNKKTERRELRQLLSALQLRIDLHDPKFVAGTYANNLGQSVQIGAPSGGVLELKTGKGFATVCKVKINTTFEPELQFRAEEDRHMCVVDMTSGEIAVDGDLFTGVQQIRKTQGSSEVVQGKSNGALETWNATICAIRSELRAGSDVYEPLARVCGLLEWIMRKHAEIPEYETHAHLIRTTLSYEPLATLYLLLQPYGNSPLLDSRFFSEWCFAPYVDSDPKATYDKFCSHFKCKVDMDARSKYVSEIKSERGLGKVDELQDVYIKHCESLFSGIGYPCEQKLWADEICFYICKRMQAIRAKHDIEAFDDLCGILRDIFPGRDHKGETKIGSEKYWRGVEMGKEISEVSSFAESFCCLQCCPDVGSLAQECRDTCLLPMQKSTYLRNLILMNE
jgi:hypothetical protein